ncbi:MAG: hypothetical protein V4510_02480 [bacterium]
MVLRLFRRKPVPNTPPAGQWVEAPHGAAATTFAIPVAVGAPKRRAKPVKAKKAKPARAKKAKPVRKAPKAKRSAKPAKKAARPKAAKRAKPAKAGKAKAKPALRKKKR